MSQDIFKRQMANVEIDSMNGVNNKEINRSDILTGKEQVTVKDVQQVVGLERGSPVEEELKEAKQLEEELEEEVEVEGGVSEEDLPEELEFTSEYSLVNCAKEYMISLLRLAVTVTFFPLLFLSRSLLPFSLP